MHLLGTGAPHDSKHSPGDKTNPTILAQSSLPLGNDGRSGRGPDPRTGGMHHAQCADQTLRPREFVKQKFDKA